MTRICTRFLEVDAGDAHLAACESCRAAFELRERHTALLAGLPRPQLPAALRQPAFLDDVYERASRQLAADIGDEAIAALAQPAETPPELDESLLESAPLRRLRPTPAPGLLWPRLAADAHSFAARHRRARRTVRSVRTFAAAAVILVAVWAARSATRGTEEVGDDFVIVRLESSRPLAASYSPSEIVRLIATASEEDRRAR